MKNKHLNKIKKVEAILKKGKKNKRNKRKTEKDGLKTKVWKINKK